MEYIEEFDKLKTKVLKYILYKKRTENEIRQKFIEDRGKILDEVIDELKDIGYINDKDYLKRAVKEKMNLKNQSIQELKYSLISKGIEKDLIDDYIYDNKEMLLNYELESAKNIIVKKINTKEENQIFDFLKKKGYMEDTIKIAMKNLEE